MVIDILNRSNVKSIGDSIIHCLTHNHAENMVVHFARDLCLHPSNFPSNSRKPHQTLPAPLVSGLQQPYQRFLPPPELPAVSTAFNLLHRFLPPPTSSRPPYLHALQTSIPRLH